VLGHLFLPLTEAAVARLGVKRLRRLTAREVRLGLLVRKVGLTLGEAFVVELLWPRGMFAIRFHGRTLPRYETLRTGPVDRAPERLLDGRVPKAQLARRLRAVVVVAVQHRADHLPAHRRLLVARTRHALDERPGDARHLRREEPDVVADAGDLADEL